MIFVDESAILYAICVSSGESPISKNIGTKIGAIIAHFAEADPINKFKNDVNKINIIIRGMPVSPILFKKFAPFTERIVPKFVYPKNATNWAAKKAKTR